MNTGNLCWYQEKCNVSGHHKVSNSPFINEINVFFYNISEASDWSTRFYGNELLHPGR